jgi:hypothetical protein
MLSALTSRPGSFASRTYHAPFAGPGRLIAGTADRRVGAGLQTLGEPVEVAVISAGRLDQGRLTTFATRADRTT